jgi:hypothetical protein
MLSVLKIFFKVTNLGLVLAFRGLLWIFKLWLHFQALGLPVIMKRGVLLFLNAIKTKSLTENSLFYISEKIAK